LRSFENFGDGKGIQVRMHEVEVSPNKLERVRQNMEKQDAIKYRANTNNKGYGFEQVIKNSKVGDAGMNRSAQKMNISKSANILPESYASPYEYNFRAAGNH
jgi:hypothetical protein